ncbi:MAG: papain-like cysteine protease family protein [Patescibacteria group bacterium]
MPYRHQEREDSCGPACVQMLLAWQGQKQSQRALYQLLQTNSQIGTTRTHILHALRALGFAFKVEAKLSVPQLRKWLHHGPVLVRFMEPKEQVHHYAVAVGTHADQLLLHDPWNGKNILMHWGEFARLWRQVSRKPKTGGWAVLFPAKIQRFR